MNFKKKLLITSFLLLTILFPNSVLAYSNYIIPGGNNIGIKINSKNVMIVGFYKVNDTYIGEDAGLKIGDLITKINNINVSNIDEMINTINELPNKEKINITFIRNNKTLTTELPLIKDENNIYKTGLYVKDQISGIGTLTYIDPTTNIFGALGHEIIEKSTMKKVEIKDGEIFKSTITGISPSRNGTPGEKNAKFYNEKIYGTINKNTETGIFGKYEDELQNNNIMEVENPNNIKTGKAVIRTVIKNDTIEEFDINIIEINKKSNVKNILFEITDKELLDKTGGVVAGMSGSPIVQNNKLIGAVTHVIVNDSTKGYGIFITTMLKEGEK